MKLHQQIAILDFGSQYAHLISRRLRDVHVFSKLYPGDLPVAKLKKEQLIGLILSGGPQSVYDANAVPYDRRIFSLNLPMLGICYGHQLIANHTGGEVKPGKVREYGFAELKRKAKSEKRKTYLFNHLPKQFTVWMSHGDSVTKLPDGFETIGSTKDCAIAAMANPQKHLYGVQFHPEVAHTQDKGRILYNFAIHICKARGDWTLKAMRKEIKTAIKGQAQGKRVFMLVSGGVDSTVAFATLREVLGKKNVLGIHIDSGLMRKNESLEIQRALAKAGFDDITAVNAEQEFLKRLQGVSNPEEKREIIGETYLDVAQKWFEEQRPAYSLYSPNVLIGQGTIYPDTIESGGTKHAERIKTHHNRIQRIAKLIKQNRIIEPLKDLYKDEVRAIGEELGLPKTLLNRHPFPGPGLGVMILCSQKKLQVPSLHLPNAQVLPIRSTGVQGDQRSYAYPLALREKKNWNALIKLSTNLTNRYRNINRVVTVCWARYGAPVSPFRHTQNLFVTKDRLELLREIHADVNEIIHKENLYHKIWEFPIILLPVGIKPRGQSIVLRPISSKEVMTVTAYRLPKATLDAIIKTISKYSQVDAVFYDITNKPPATVQWE